MEQQLPTNDNNGKYTLSNGVKYIGTSIFTFVFDKYLGIVNSFLSAVYNQLGELIPENSSSMSRYEQAKIMSKMIDDAFKDPVFQAQLNAFMSNIKQVIVPFLEEMDDLFAKEGDNLANSAFKIANRVSRNAVNGVFDGVESGLGAIPVVGSAIDLLKILQAVLDSASVVSVEFFKNMTMFMDKLLNTFGETSGPAINTIAAVRDIFESIKKMQDRLNGQMKGGKKRKTIKRRYKKRKA